MVRNKEILLKYYSNFLYFTFFSITFLNQFMLKSGTVMNLLTVLWSGSIACFVCCIDGKKIIKYIGLCICFSLLMYISLHHTGNTDLPELAWVFVYFFVGYFVHSFPISYKVSMASFYMMVVVLALCVIAKVDPNVIMVGGSRNLISHYLIFYMALYFILRYRQRKSYDVLAAFLSFFFSLWSMGRGGIIVSGLILLVVIFFCVKDKIHFNFKLTYLDVWLFVVLLYFSYDLYLKDFIMTSIVLVKDVINRFLSEGLSSGRLLFWKEYFDGVFSSFSNFFLGVPFSDYEALSYYNNPHNSFIMLHAKFGIIGFGFVVVFIFKWLINHIKERRYFECLLILCVMLRACLDWLAFPGSLDILFWFLFLDVYGDGALSSEFKIICK